MSVLPLSICNPQIETSAYHAGRAWYALVVFEIIILASGVDLAIVTLLVHPIEAAFRINDVGFTAITAIPVAIGVAVAYYPAGLLADTFRRRTMIASGVVIWDLGALIAAHADSEVMFFLARLLAGIGAAVLAPAIFSMITDMFPRARRALAMGIYSATASVGYGLGLTLCGVLVAEAQHNGILHVSGILFSPWQQCFGAVAAIGIVVLVLLCTVHEPRRGEQVILTNSNLMSTLHIFSRYLHRHWLLWVLLLIAYTMNATSYAGISAWGPAFGMRHYGATGASSIALLGAFTAGGALLGSVGASLIAQHGINHDDPRILPRILTATSIISSVLAAGFPYMPSWLLAVACIGVLGTTFSVPGLLTQIAIQETAPNEVRGQLFGLWGFTSFIPLSVGATLVASLASGVFAKAGGLGPALAVMGGATGAISVVLYAFSGHPYRRAKRELLLRDDLHV